MKVKLYGVAFENEYAMKEFEVNGLCDTVPNEYTFADESTATVAK